MAALLGIVIFLTVMGGFFGGLVLLVRHLGNKREEAWQAAAAQNGLFYSGRQIVGQLHGQPVRVSTVTRGSGDSRTTYTVVSSHLPMPLDLGFKLRKHGFVNDMFHRSEDHVIGDRQFDDSFIVSADEPNRVRCLLGPKMRRLLLQQLGATSRYDVSDHGATIECTGVSRSVPWLTWAIQTAARISAGLERARHAVPVATPLGHHREAWRNFALANGMRGQDTPLSMWGNLEGANVSAYAVRTGRLHYEMEVKVTLAQPLGIGLVVQPFGLMDKIATFFGSQDHRLGDPVFDDTFRVKTAHPDMTTQLLDEEVRRELLMLQREKGPVTVNDNSITVRLKQVPHHPSIVPRTVRRMLTVVDQLGSRVGALTVGPYR